MNEKDVLSESKKVFLLMLLFFCVVGIMLESMSFIYGIVIGYVICFINFHITIKMSELILKTKQNVILVIVMFILKTLLLILGFAICLLTDYTVNIFSVFAGYLITPITIYWLNFKTRKEG